MAIVVESTANANVTSSTSLTITKPTGLVVGDLMVALLSTYNGTISTLSGWTLVDNAESTQGASGVQYKVADSGDVAASDFTFTFSASTLNTGSILRVSGAGTGLVLGSTTGVDNSDSGTLVSFPSALSPTEDGSLFLMPFAVEGSSSGDIETMSGYFVTGDTISWTELYDEGVSSVGEPHNAGAYGIQTTATTISAFGAISSAILDHVAAMIVVFRPQTDASGSNVLTTASTETFVQSGTAGAATNNILAEATAETFTQSGRGESPTQYSNEDKPSADWSNQDK